MSANTPQSPVDLSIPTDDGDLPGLLCLPEGASDAPAPGLVVVQEIFGLSDYILQRCADLAALGYAVLAPQLFARLDPPRVGFPDPDGTDEPAVEAWLGEAMGATGELDWDRAEADVLAALEALRAQPSVAADATGLVGFCFGGGLAFAATARAASAQVPDVRADERADGVDAPGAALPPSALVSFYGSALPTLLDRAAAVTVPSLHVFGTADAFIPLDQVERIREAVTAAGTREQVRFELHAGAGHAFDNPHPAFHHPVASIAAWGQATDFLAREQTTG